MQSMQGTPYHIEGLRRSEGDPRRYWGRCRYVDFNTQICMFKKKKCTYCTACIMYAPVPEEEFKKRQREKQHMQYMQKKKQKEEAKKRPDFYIREGTLISHDLFGEGSVLTVGTDYIVVKFRVRNVKFSVPACFMDPKFHLKKKE